MRFKIYENLVEDVNEEVRKISRNIDEVEETLSEIGFERIDELNGISFNQEFTDNDTNYNCQFYVDTEARKYQSYITSTDESNKEKTTFQQSGDIDEIVEAAEKFVNVFNQL